MNYRFPIKPSRPSKLTVRLKLKAIFVWQVNCEGTYFGMGIEMKTWRSKEEIETLAWGGDALEGASRKVSRSVTNG